jgi:large subunit ribosomal protein L30
MKSSTRGKTRKRREAIEALVRLTRSPIAAGSKTIQVRMERSAIGGTQSQRATLRCLGLRRRGSLSTVPDTIENRGRIRMVAHLVRIEEA